MAAKKIAKRKYTKRSNGVEGDAPEGFTKIEGAHISGFWKPEATGDNVRGIVGEMITGKGEDGKPNIYSLLTLTTNDVEGDVIGQDAKTKRKFKAEVGEGMVIGLSGAVLLSRLRGREGREVFIRYTGLGEKKIGKNQARLFDVFERAKS